MSRHPTMTPRQVVEELLFEEPAFHAVLAALTDHAHKQLVTRLFTAKKREAAEWQAIYHLLARAGIRHDQSTRTSLKA